MDSQKIPGMRQALLLAVKSNGLELADSDYTDDKVVSGHEVGLLSIIQTFI